MITTIAPPAPDRPPQGHCSKCGRIWRLETDGGVCPHCHQTAYCETRRTKPHQLKPSRRRKQRQADHNGNGYDQLQGVWLSYYKVASRHANRAKAQEREDLLHTIILTLAVAERNNGHQPFTEGTMHRIASRCVFHYWYDHYRVNNGLDCNHCSKAQRRKCKEDWLYGECPKAIKLESLNKPIIDSEGNLTELGELIADPKSLDVDVWDRDYLWQLGYKPRLVDIANKLKAGIPLNNGDRSYLKRFRKDSQISLFQ